MSVCPLRYRYEHTSVLVPPSVPMSRALLLMLTPPISLVASALANRVQFLGVFGHASNRSHRSLEEDQHDVVVGHEQPAQIADWLAMARGRQHRRFDALIEVAEVRLPYTSPEALGEVAGSNGVGHDQTLRT